MPRRILVLDTETEPTRFDAVTEIHKAKMTWTCLLTESTRKDRRYNEHWQYFENPSKVCAYLESSLVQRRPLYVVGSNLVFDLASIGFFAYFDRVGWTLDFCYNAGMSFILYLKKDRYRLKCLSIQNFLPFSVKALGDMVGLPKMDVDFSNTTSERLKAYCRRDVEIVKEAFVEYVSFLKDNDMGNFRPTRASQALGTFTHKYMTDPVQIHADDGATEIERAAYFGGRTECFRIGDFTGREIVNLDVNSMYPYVMQSRRLPYKYVNFLSGTSFAYLRSALRDYMIVADVTLDTDEPCYATRHNDRVVFPVGRFRTGVCSEGLRRALERDHLVEFHRGCMYQGDYIFRDFVNDLYPLKTRFKQEGRAIWTATIKGLMNSLYGKFAQRRPCVVTEETVPECDFTQFDYYVPAEGKHYLERTLFHVRTVYSGKEETSCSFPAISAHVTEYARLYLYDLLTRADRAELYYCDTDSIMVGASQVERYSDLMNAYDLGALSVRGVTKGLRLYGAKDYAFGDKVKIKGIRSNAVKLNEHEYLQDFFPSLNTLLRKGQMVGFPVYRIKKRLTRNYTKGEVTASGSVLPFRFGPDAPLRGLPPEPVSPARSAFRSVPTSLSVFG